MHELKVCCLIIRRPHALNAHVIQDAFISLLQSEDGKLFKVMINHEEEEVTAFNIVHCQ